MVIAQIVEGFRQRGSWTKIQGIFKMCNLSTSRGWKETTKKLINEQDLNQDENFSEKIEQLFSYYNSFLLVSNKAVKLYSRERKVIELGFVTDGGSTKHEKMRKNSTCLRIEPYHDAGKRAIDHITPYRLAVSWDVENLDNFKNTLELSLPGNVKELSEVPPDLGRFSIKNCICIEDYNFVLNKVLTYLKTL